MKTMFLAFFLVFGFTAVSAQTCDELGAQEVGALTEKATQYFFDGAVTDKSVEVILGTFKLEISDCHDYDN